MTKKEEPKFENNLKRLEEILASMNSGETGLEDAMKLFEEATQLIQGSMQRLEKAEQKIETLVKEKDGELKTDEKGEPIREDFPERGSNE